MVEHRFVSGDSARLCSCLAKRAARGIDCPGRRVALVLGVGGWLARVDGGSADGPDRWTSLFRWSAGSGGGWLVRIASSAASSRGRRSGGSCFDNRYRGSATFWCRWSALRSNPRHAVRPALVLSDPRRFAASDRFGSVSASGSWGAGWSSSGLVPGSTHACYGVVWWCRSKPSIWHYASPITVTSELQQRSVVADSSYLYRIEHVATEGLGKAGDRVA